MELDLGYWLNLGKQIGTVLGLGLLFGGPVGFLVWRKTGKRRRAVVLGLVTAVIGLLALGYIYLTVVLCPPEAMCA